MNNDRINELCEILTEARDAYYNSDPIMTDFEFDTLEEELRLLSPDNNYFENIGSSVSKVSAWKKATHKISMTSLNKCQGVEEFKKWCTDNHVDLINIQDKLDGSSVDLEYDNGKLIAAITRGDGFIGEDILQNVIKMKNVKKNINGFTGSLRGEIFILADDFEKVNSILIDNDSKPMSNPRNGANGICKRYDGTFCEYLTIYYYDIHSENLSFKSENDKMNYFKELGLQPCFYKLVTVNEAIKLFERYQDSLRAKTKYDIDGLVCKINDIDKQKLLGSLGANPKGQIAWKFDSVTAIAKVIDIEWRLGNKRLTPVIHIEPTKIGGVVVSKMTAHNFDIYESLKLTKGCKILFKRSNDVIPIPIKVIENGIGKFDVPKLCPICKSDVEVDGKFLMCSNKNCDGLAVRNLYKWITKLEIMDVGENTIIALYQANKISEPSDFYKLTVADISSLPRLGEKSAIKMIKHLEEKKEISLPIFISALNIDNFSTSTAENLMENGFDTIEKIFNATENELIQIKGIEIKTATQIVTGINAKKNIIDNLFNVGIKIKGVDKMKSNSNKLEGMSFCFTGPINRTDSNGKRYIRDMIHTIVLENGGNVLDSVKKGLNYLVMANPDSISSKTQKAKQLSISILSESDFFKMVD